MFSSAFFSQVKNTKNHFISQIANISPSPCGMPVTHIQRKKSWKNRRSIREGKQLGGKSCWP